MADLLPTLDFTQSNSHSSTTVTGANVTARLYVESHEPHHVSLHLPKVEPRARGSKVKVKVKDKVKEKVKERRTKAKTAHVNQPAENHNSATNYDLSLADSDSESSCSSFSSSGSDDSYTMRNSEKTETDHLKSALRSCSLHSAPNSPSLSISVSLPNVLPPTETSPTVENMRQHLASGLSRHNHHIFLHNGQCALNSHIQITVNSKAATEIAAHAVVTEVPALLPIHRQRAAANAALHANSMHRDMPAIAPARGLSLSLHSPADAASSVPRRHSTASAEHRAATGLKSPMLSPRGTALLSPLYGRSQPVLSPSSAPHPIKEQRRDQLSHHPPSPLFHHASS